MKLNKYQLMFIEETVKSINSKYTDIKKLISKVNRNSVKDLNNLLDEIAKIMLNYTVAGDSMQISAADVKQIQKELNSITKGFILEQNSSANAIIFGGLMEVAKDRDMFQSYLFDIGSIDFNIQPLPDDVLKKVVNAAVGEKVWSDRLWTNKKALKSKLDSDIYKFLKGEITVNDIKNVIKRDFNQDNYNTKRLVNTEVARVQQGVIDKNGEQYGVEWQMFVATLDNKTSQVCQERDGKIYRKDNSDRPIPPLHPSCRSCLSDVPGEDYKPKLRRDNETKEVIPYVTYEEWKKNKGI